MRHGWYVHQDRLVWGYQPWDRSGQGQAWDGLSRYDLTRFNDWYFRRLREFAELCDRKGTLLFHNHYMQHALLEIPAHYADFPWRLANPGRFYLLYTLRGGSFQLS